MTYMIDYSTRSGRKGTKWIDFAVDETEAITRFMDWFFSTNPGDAVRIESTSRVEFIGDSSSLDLIDSEQKEASDE